MLVALLLVLVVLFAVSGVLGALDSRFRKHGPHALTWRWLTGEAWHGKPVTNRGWTRPGTKALTPTGFAHRRHYLPRWQHAAWRVQWTLAALLTAAGLLLQSRRTADYLAVTATAGAGFGAWRSRAWVQEHSHRKNYYKPGHARLAPLCGIPVANKPESWLDIPRDLSYAALTWPKGAQLPKPQERQEIESVASSTFGLKGAKPKWQFTGPYLKLKLIPPVPPPEWVYLDDIKWSSRVAPDLGRDAIRQAMRDAGVDDLILGIGEEGKVVQVSLRNDSPHLALSADTGKGKSVVVRCILAQILFRGGIAAILDNKLVSHPSLRGLPNVAYCDDISKIHDFLVWLDEELDRRAKFIRAHTDYYGNLTGSPGPRLMVVLEELNLLANRLQSYWDMLRAEDKALPRDMRENLPAVSPAKRALENASYIGRELKVHLFFVSQRLSARATAGSADVRMNIGTRLLAGYDDDTWKMLVGKQTPMPPPSRHQGRMQVYVKGGDLAEAQIAFFTHAETRKFAESGTARVPSKLRHLTEFTPAGVSDPVPPGTTAGGGDGSAVIVTEVPQLDAPVHNWMTINQAKQAGMLPHYWTKPGGAFRTAKHRAAKEGIPVPPVRGKKGSEALYDAVELADFLERITERQAA
jgi:hypothetical protein